MGTRGTILGLLVFLAGAQGLYAADVGGGRTWEGREDGEEGHV